MSTTRAALEAALAADPDDVVAHSVYADLLTEEDDPRGEFVRLQLIKEFENITASQWKAIQNRLEALLKQHEAKWLGPLARHARPSTSRRDVPADLTVSYRRGWLYSVEVSLLTDEICQALVAAPIARLLSELEIQGNLRAEVEFGLGPVRSFCDPRPLADSPSVRNLRRLELGTVETWRLGGYDDGLGLLVESAPRLEDLTLFVRQFDPDRVFAAPLPHLKSLRATSNNARLPLGLLAANPTLGRLVCLQLDLVQFRPSPGEEDYERESYSPDELRQVFRSPNLEGMRVLILRLPGFGDSGVDELVNSPMLERLRGLDLSRCDITDEGAQLLAAHPAVPRLESLRLDNNLLSPIGIDALAAVGVRVSERQYFVRGDWSDSDELMEDSDLA